MVPFTDLNLIDTDGVDTAQRPVLQAPIDRGAHRSMDSVPTRVETSGDLAPGKASSPSAEKVTVIVSDPLFTIGPRHLFNSDTTTRAIDPPHDVLEHHGEAPEWDMREKPGFEMIVDGPFVRAARANGATSYVRPNAEDKGLFMVNEKGLVEDKALEMHDRIDECQEAHWEGGGCLDRTVNEAAIPVRVINQSERA